MKKRNVHRFHRFYQATLRKYGIDCASQFVIYAKLYSRKVKRTLKKYMGTYFDDYLPF